MLKTGPSFLELAEWLVFSFRIGQSKQIQTDPNQTWAIRYPLQILFLPLQQIKVWILGGSLFLLFCSCLIVPMRRWGRVRSQLSKQMETFTFASSSCQHQADREEILSALVALAVDHKIVGEFATTEEVCKVLETRAREVIPQRMHDAISFGGLPARILGCSDLHI